MAFSPHPLEKKGKVGTRCCIPQMRGPTPRQRAAVPGPQTLCPLHSRWLPDFTTARSTLLKHLPREREYLVGIAQKTQVCQGEDRRAAIGINSHYHL
jgi:hypothetical protein